MSMNSGVIVSAESQAVNATEPVRNEAIERLRTLLPPGTTVSTILRRVSRSGMQRTIDVYVSNEHGQLRYLTADVAIVTEHPMARDGRGLTIRGAGMDMGFALVYQLARVIYPDGFPCAGVHCPCNGHAGGNQSETPHQHQDGGYALRQRWI